jgi:hypothetical protein
MCRGPMWYLMSELANNGITEVSIDEKWMPEWVQFGIEEFERSLLRHAQFDKYLRDKEEKRSQE